MCICDVHMCAATMCVVCRPPLYSYNASKVHAMPTRVTRVEAHKMKAMDLKSLSKAHEKDPTPTHRAGRHRMRPDENDDDGSNNTCIV